MKLPEQQTEKAEWLMTTCNHALLSIVDVFSHYYSRLHAVVLKDLYDRIAWCAEQDNEQLAKSGIECLGTLVTSNGDKFTDDIWDRTDRLMFDLFRNSIPHGLLSWKPEGPPVILQSAHQPLIQENHVGPEGSVDDKLESGKMNSERSGKMNSKRGRQENAMMADKSTAVGGAKSTIKSSQQRRGDRHATAEAVFRDLQIKCVIQLELIQVIDLVVFGGGFSRRDDDRNSKEAKALMAESPVFATKLGAAGCNSDEFGSLTSATGEYTTAPSTPAGNGTVAISSGVSVGGSHSNATTVDLDHRDGSLYRYLTAARLFSLIDCLMASHDFAKQFNSDQSQRNLLWKAGFKGRDKPNLLSQEKASIACAVRILFRMYGDEGTRNDSSCAAEVQNRLITICKDALWYYAGLNSEQHRDAWTPIVLLILCRTMRLPPAHFRIAAVAYHKIIAKLVVVNVSPEVRSVLAKFIELLPLR